MQMAEQFDISTLAWVKGEIDETLKQARIALEAYVEDPDDEAQLQFCITYIHQVYGTLHMVELGGAAMFAEEVEAFATALQQGAVEDKEQGYELLMRAILQLPDYLEGLLAGQRDNPSGLVPLLNELRVLRGAEVLSSAEFFSPDLSVQAPPKTARFAEGIDSAAAAKKLHRYYLASLAKILKGTELDASLKSVGIVMDKLLAVAEGESWRRFLWVSAALIDALRDDGIALSRDTKPLLGKIEQAIRLVAAKGEAGLDDGAVAKILQPMLFQLAQADSVGPITTAVRDAFHLEEYRPQGSGLGGVNAELKQTVSVDIMEELSRIKETFDVFVRGDRRTTGDLETMAKSLTSIADTLSLLQEESLRESLQRQTDVIRQLLSGETEANDETLMGIAGAILAVESALRDWGSAAPVVAADASEEQVADTGDSPETVAEHQRVTRQVMKEARDDLIRIREAVNSYLEKPEDKSILDDLPSVLHMIVGSLTMLSYKRVAQVLTSCREFIKTELIEAETLPSEDALDALADAIMSVEYYLEAFVQSRVHPGSVLDVAETAVASLGYPVGSVQDNSMDAEKELAALEGPQAEVAPVVPEPPQVVEQSPAVEIPAEDVEVTPSVDSVTVPARETATQNVTPATVPAVEPEPEKPVEAKPEPTPSSSTAVKPSPNVEVDDEILEIFIEEAEEELNNISEQLPVWRNNTSDAETLGNIRRSFHTLKGSGRLVGASELGEFAWAFENLLNRVIDGTVSPNAALFDMLEQAVEALPELISQFKDGTQPQADIALLQEMAFEMASTGGLKAPKPEPVTPVEPVVEKVVTVESAQAIPGVPELDEVLLEIYSKESDGHLEEIDNYVAGLRQGGSRKVTEPLVRALHTLQGSSRMAGVSSVADVYAKLEKYAKTLQANGEVVNDNGLSAIEACTAYTRDMLTYLANRSGRTAPNNAEAQRLADKVYADVQHMEAAAHAAPEAGLAQKEEPAEIPPGSTEPFPGEPSKPVEQAPTFEQQNPPEVFEEALAAIGEEVEESVDTPAVQAVTNQPETGEPAEAVIEEEYDPELLEIFLEEAVDILDASEATLQAWVDSPDDKSLVHELQRQLHTLKGGARMAGISAIGNLSHSLETVFDAVVDGLIQRSPEMIDLLQLSHDRLVTMIEQVRNHEPVVTGDDLIRKVDSLASGNVEPESPVSLVPPRERPAEPNVSETPTETPVAPPVAERPTPNLNLVIEPALEKPAEKTVAEEPVSIVPLDGLPEITPDMSALEEAISDVEFNLSTWMRDVNDRSLFDALRRSGIALGKVSHEFGIRELIEVTDALVALLLAINDGHVATSKKSSDLIMLALDRLQLMIAQIKTLEPVDSSIFIAADIQDLISSSVTAEEGVQGQKDEDNKQVESVTEKGDEAENRRRAPRIQHEVVRVRSDLLDNLVNFAGEVSIYRSRVEQQIGSFRGSIDEMDQTVERLREQIRQVDIETEAQIASRREEVQKLGHDDFDPLEFDRFTHMQQVSRSMMESLSDLVSIEDMLANLTRESETLLLQQSRVNTELQENLMHTRMVPLSDYAPRLRRIVRQTSAELGKRTSLRFEGAEVEMDRNVVERMMAPLEHMLRNSIAHGIEDRETRSSVGKPEEGSITIRLSREGSEIVVLVTDDGAGINISAVKKKALERGLMKSGAKLRDKEIINFILESGFSTAESLSQISGRGVGMDVVNSEIKQLGGVLEINSEQGQGTSFTVRLPLTLSVSRALLVFVGEDIYAIPLLGISGIERIASNELEALLSEENPVFSWVGEDYDLMHLTNILGAGTGMLTGESGKVPLLLTRSGEHRIAFAIDGLIGSREIVVKSLGPQLSTLQDLAGATILADGSVALIIDMPSLIRRGLARKGGAVSGEEVVEQHVERVPVVMVVDDSITVRKVTERLLKRHNLTCITAKDGVDALAVLDETIPDVMLLDIEMPRMDGFELATHIRNSDRLRDIPIIMITSRTGDKHRQRAMDIGVNKYMGKPYTEVDLLENIESLIGKQD